MIPNEKSLNYKVVDLVEVYNFRINFITIRIHMNLLYFFENFATVNHYNTAGWFGGKSLQWQRKLLQYPFAGWTGVMFSTVHLPPVNPAVPTFRRMNWRQDDIFEKKNSAYIFDKSKKI